MKRRKKIKYGLSEHDCKGINFSYDYIEERDKFIKSILKNKINKFETKIEDNALKIISFIAIFGMLSVSVDVVFPLLKKSKKLVKSPYDGNSIVMTLDKQYKEIKKIYNLLYPLADEETIKKEFEEMSLKQKKDYLLFSALLKNNDYDKEDIRFLSGYLGYLEDNNFTNYDEIYKIIRTSDLEKNVDIQKNNVTGNYDVLNNKINLQDYKALPHEFFHLEDAYLHNCYNPKDYEYQDWFVEGFDEVLSCEYMTKKNTSYPVECAAIRSFTEILGYNKMLEVRSTGDFSIFVDALTQKGANIADVNKLLKLLNEHIRNEKDEDFVNFLNSEEIKKQIYQKFIIIYKQTHKGDNSVTPIFVHNIESILDSDLENYNEFNNYLFNSKLNNTILFNDIKTQGGGQQIQEYFHDDYLLVYVDDVCVKKCTYEIDEDNNIQKTYTYY